jgi:hypothetical protein
MGTMHERLTARFYDWEKRGRGWQVFEHPTTPEPPFLPFCNDELPEQPCADDGRKSTFVSSLVQKLSRNLSTRRANLPLVFKDEEPEPALLNRGDLVELQPFPPEKLDLSREEFHQFLRSVSLSREPLTFELLATREKVAAQFVLHPEDAPLFRRQSQAFFPEVIFVERESSLENLLDTTNGDELLAVDFGLAHEFMLSLATGKTDPFVGIVGALSELSDDEFAIYQVIFQPVIHSWHEEILRSVTHADGKPFFVNAPELASAAEAKIAHPLYAAVVRILVKAETERKALQLACDLAGSFRSFAKPQGNELIPLQNGEYELAAHVEDVLRRQTRRSGMLLNADELLSFVHLPSTAVRSPRFERQSGKTKAAPPIVQQTQGVLLGTNEHAGKSIEVRVSPEQRVRHCHVIGASGTGKSTLLFNLIRQDIENGEGIAVLDPHGDLVDKILGIIPPKRIEEVVLLDPSDEEYAVGFNILSAHSDHEKTLLASDLVSVFQRLSTSWGDQMHSVLQNSILAFLDSSKGGTLADLRRFLIEPEFRSQFLRTVSDPNVLYYWQKGFPQLGGNKSIGPVLTRLEMLLAQRPIAQMVSQQENRLDFGHIMDSGKIFLAKLPEGLLGRENSFLLGTLLISKFQQLAMARQAKQIAQRRDFWIYCDEFANFISPSMAEILSGARKYRIGLTLAHHDLQQLQRNSDVASAVMTHPFTRIVFRVGDEDARKIADGFAFFEAQDFKNLEAGQAIARVERSNFDFNLSIPLPESGDDSQAEATRNAVITASRKKYGTERRVVEALLRQAWDVQQSEQSSKCPDRSETHDARPQRPNTPTPSSASSVSPPPPYAPSTNRDPITAKPEIKKRSSEPRVVPDLGKGGEQHRAIQDRIKKASQALGFHAVIEKPILNELGSIDVLLERGGESIACEISLSTTVDHEIGNIRKCLKAGYEKIAIICLSEDRLEKIRQAASGSFGPEISLGCVFVTPDRFIADLQKSFAPPPSQKPEPPPVRRGYSIKRSISTVSKEEQARKEDEAIKAIADVMKAKKK